MTLEPCRRGLSPGERGVACGALGWFIAATLSACAPAPQPSLPPATELGPARMIRQQVRVTHAGQTRGFSAVLQTGEDELLLLGLTPMGTKAFVVRQHNGEVETQNFMGTDLPAPAEAILLDIHRAYFFAMADQPRRDGWTRTRADGQWVRELWREGKLLERVFKGSRRRRPGVRVRYPQGARPGEIAGEVVLEHGELGLVLEIRTIEVRELGRG